MSAPIPETSAAEGVVVWIPTDVDRPTEMVLATGETMTFGRADESDLTLASAAVSWTAGVIRAVEDYWTISNSSRTATYVVENSEGAGEYVKVPPGRLELPVPFEFSRVLLVPGRSTVGFNVTAGRHSYLADGDLSAGGPEPTTLAFNLDRTARYFAVLVALCEPRLRDPSSTAMPSASGVVERLRSKYADLTVEAVNAQVRYLAGTKLRLRREGEARSDDRQRQNLVAVALRFDIVREDDLRLLPPPERRGSL